MQEITDADTAYATAERELVQQGADEDVCRALRPMLVSKNTGVAMKARQFATQQHASIHDPTSPEGQAERRARIAMAATLARQSGLVNESTVSRAPGEDAVYGQWAKDAPIPAYPGSTRAEKREIDPRFIDPHSRVRLRPSNRSVVQTEQGNFTLR